MAEGELDAKAEEFIGKCMNSHERLEKADQLVEAVKAMSSLASNPKEEAKSIILGDSQAKRNFIVDVVKAYRSEKPSKSVKEFFDEKYRDRALVLLKPADAIREAIRNRDAAGKAEAEEKPAAVEQVMETVEEKPAAGAIKEPTHMNTENRIEMLASLLSDEQKTPVETVKETEMDVIEKIMSITDENSNRVSDDDVLNAAIGLVADDKTEHSFILESLGSGHRDELLKRAVDARTGR